MSYINLLTRIKNAQAVKKEEIRAPYSRLDMEIAEVLVRKGFVKSVVKKGRLPKRIMEIKLKYGDDDGAIGGIKLNSKPSRRVYAGYRDLKSFGRGRGGISLISTSKGIMTAKEARQQKLGGELLFEIW